MPNHTSSTEVRQKAKFKETSMWCSILFVHGRLFTGLKCLGNFGKSGDYDTTLSQLCSATADFTIASVDSMGCLVGLVATAIVYIVLVCHGVVLTCE
jgi:hypothetical protein